MTENTLPQILTPKEVAGYLRVEVDTIFNELEAGNLRGFKIGAEWRCSEEDILSYIKGDRIRTEITYTQPRQTKTHVYDRDWNIVETEPFDFNWPKTGGGGYPEHYDKAYEATTTVSGQEYTFKIGFGNRESAGQKRRRFTIWLGNRAVVEFAGSNNYDDDGLLAGIIRLRNGKQLTTQRIPDEYKGFRVERYNSVVKGPRASTGMAVIVHKDDLKAMLNHAVIRATWKELI